MSTFTLSRRKRLFSRQQAQARIVKEIVKNIPKIASDIIQIHLEVISALFNTNEQKTDSIVKTEPDLAKKFKITDCPDHRRVKFLTHPTSQKIAWAFKETDSHDSGDMVANALDINGYIGAPKIEWICLDGKSGVLKKYLEPDLGTSTPGMTHEELYVRKELIESPLYHDQIAKIAAFNYLMGHQDAHLQNIVIQDEKLKPIDCKSCFTGFYKIKLKQILSGNVWHDCLYDGEGIHIDNDLLKEIIKKETPKALKDWILKLDIEKQTSHLEIPHDILLGLKARASILKFYVRNNIPLEIGAIEPFASKSKKILRDTIKSLKDKIRGTWGPILPDPRKPFGEDKKDSYEKFITRNNENIERIFLESLNESLREHVLYDCEGVD
jgi:hypothetical protein